MADTTKKVSELETASQVDSTDLVMLSQGSSQSGFASLKTTILAIAQKIVSGINFTSALQTENKTITGAINEVAQGGGGGASELDDLDDVSISSPTNGQVLKYNSTSQEWENANAGGGSGGHTILDNDGTALSQEDDLQFKGTYSHDDLTNGKTVVEITREMTQAQYDLLSANERKGIIRIIDDNYVCDGTEVKYSTGVSVGDKIDGIVYTGSLDDLKTTGTYGHVVTASSNVPTTVNEGSIITIQVLDSQQGLITQVLYYGNLRVFVRRFYNGSWNDWNLCGTLRTKTVSVTTNASGVATLNSLDSEEHILSASVQDRLAIPFWVGSGHANWVKVLNWSNMGVTAETVSVTYTYI